jgi:hypothetical protein
MVVQDRHFLLNDTTVFALRWGMTAAGASAGRQLLQKAANANSFAFY